MRKLHLSITLALLIWSTSSRAATYFVDGSCSSSGTGAALTCGATGPTKTIMEAVKIACLADSGHCNPTAAPITIDVRGGSNVYNEYLGLWGTGSRAAPGGGAYYALKCTASAPCVIQGCAQADGCPSDETALVSGLVRRTDWAVCDAGAGCGFTDTNVWYRTMEQRDYTNAGLGPDWVDGTQQGQAVPDTYDPGFLALGSTQDGTRTIIQYNTTASDDAVDGRWHYNNTSHRIFYNPVGSANPNTDVSVWVPDRSTILAAGSEPQANQSTGACPDTTSCPPLQYVTFRRLIFEGGRGLLMDVYGNTAHLDGSDISLWMTNLLFDHMTLRYTANVPFYGRSFDHLTLSNVLIENFDRGVTFGTQNGFGTRLFDINHATFDTVTSRHCGLSGTTQTCNGGPNSGAACTSSTDCSGSPCVGFCSSWDSSKPWLDTPWNIRSGSAGNLFCSNCIGLQIKNSNDVRFINPVTLDTSYVGISLDACTNVTIDGADIRRAWGGIDIADGQDAPSPSGGRTANITVRNSRFDDVGWNTSGAIGIYNTDIAPTAGEWYVRAYNNMISHVALGGIVLANYYQGIVQPGISLWNNTVWQDRTALGYTGECFGGPCSPAGSCNCFNAGASGVTIGGTEASGGLTTLTNFTAENNLFSDLNLHGFYFGAGITPTNVVVDYNLYRNSDGEWTVPTTTSCSYFDGPSPVKWGATCYGTNAFTTFQSATGQEAHGINNLDPGFVNVATSPPNLHIAAPSAAQTPGVPCLVATDFDGQPRTDNNHVICPTPTP